MDKQKADEIITEYLKKLFGFSLFKMCNIDRAEELTSRITMEVYTSLLKKDYIENIDGYIYKIAHNVYARFLHNETKGAHLSLDLVSIPSADDFTVDFTNSESCSLLRREIAYLAKTQREIVVLHYYDKLKLADIAKQLGISPGTVKWHLYDARNNLKEGMNTVREVGALGVKPIRLANMGHSGRSGNMGDTSDFLNKRLTQNIAYAAYHNPKSINEIAEELGVSPLFIEDEVFVLEEYGFMDKVAGGKYMTNIYISEPTSQCIEAGHILYNKYAKILCEKYVPLVMEALHGYDKSKLYIPDNDFNLLAWSAITFACDYKLYMDKSVDTEKYSVKRKDGGDYIAFAHVEDNIKVSFDESKYGACGNMTRGSMKNYPIFAWQLNTYYDNREGNWRECLSTDFDYLYEFVIGTLKKEESQIEKFRRLYDKGYLRDDDTVNIIIINDGKENNFLSGDFAKAIPAITDELKDISDEFDNEMQKINMPLYPKHMQGLCKAWTSNCMCHNATRTRVLEQLLQTGVLTLPTEKQKAGINTLLFSDTLPK